MFKDKITHTQSKLMIKPVYILLINVTSQLYKWIKITTEKNILIRRRLCLVGVLLFLYCNSQPLRGAKEKDPDSFHREETICAMRVKWTENNYCSMCEEKMAWRSKKMALGP